MSRKRRSNRWRRGLFFYVLTPLAVWLVLFVVWLFWYDITGTSAPDKTSSQAGVEARGVWSPNGNRDTRPQKKPLEHIPEEDRRKLDNILKKR